MSSDVDANNSVCAPAELFRHVGTALAVVALGILLGLATTLSVLIRIVFKLDMLVRLLRSETGEEPAGVVRAHLLHTKTAQKNNAIEKKREDSKKKRESTKPNNGTSCAEDIEEGEED
tara:strand:- start:292 stop:645 length:354 start_codon:yes stop_codon:yes gene_type:complete